MNRIFSSLDKPIYKDWIFYLWLFSLVAVIPQNLTLEFSMSGLIDFVIAVLVQSLFFLLLPAKVRKRFRNKNKLQNS